MKQYGIDSAESNVRVNTATNDFSQVEIDIRYKLSTNEFEAEKIREDVNGLLNRIDELVRGFEKKVGHAVAERIELR